MANLHCTPGKITCVLSVFFMFVPHVYVSLLEGKKGTSGSSKWLAAANNLLGLKLSLSSRSPSFTLEYSGHGLKFTPNSILMCRKFCSNMMVGSASSSGFLDSIKTYCKWPWLLTTHGSWLVAVYYITSWSRKEGNLSTVQWWFQWTRKTGWTKVLARITLWKPGTVNYHLVI